MAGEDYSEHSKNMLEKLRGKNGEKSTKIQNIQWIDKK